MSATAIDSLLWFVRKAPDLPFDLAWGARIALSRRTLKYQSYLYCCLVCLLLTYPGSTVPKVLVGKKPTFLESPIAIGGAVLMWFLVMFSPFARIFNHTPVKVLTLVLSTVSWVRITTQMVDFGTFMYRDNAVGSIVLGTLGGSVGGLLDQWERRDQTKAKTLSTLGLEMTFLMSIFLYTQHKWAIAPLRHHVMMFDHAVILCYCVLLPWTLYVNFVEEVSLFGPWNRFFYRVCVGRAQPTTTRPMVVMSRREKKTTTKSL